MLLVVVQQLLWGATGGAKVCWLVPPPCRRCCSLLPAVDPVCTHLAVLPARLMQCCQAAQGSAVHPMALPKVVTQLAEGLCATQATARGKG